MEQVRKELQEFLQAAKDGKGGLEEHRKLTHWGKGIRYLIEIEQQEDVRKKIGLYQQRLDMVLKERYGEIEMKSG